MKKIFGLLLAICMCLFCVACAPADMGKAKEKMEEAGYKVTVVGETAAELLSGAYAVDMMNATKSEGGLLNLEIETVTAILFESSSAAKDYYDSVKDDKEEDESCKQSGKWVITGTEEAIKAFTK